MKVEHNAQDLKQVIKLKLSTKGRYGVKAMLDIAINYTGEPISIKSISERTGTTEYYLEQLFSHLRKAGLIKSVRGTKGGYVLAKDPKDITVYEIMEVLEGPIEISDCIEDSTCGNADCCASRLLWVRIKDSIEEIFKDTTLENMVNDYKNMKKNHETNKVSIDLGGNKDE